MVLQIDSIKKKKILEVFVTSASDQIYAVRHNVPPEMFGAFGSYFSRNPRDFREHLWDAITGQVEEEQTEINPNSLDWLASGNFNEPFNAIKNGIAKSQDFFKKWYGKYSHKSIANTVWIPMVATNVSQLFAKALAYDQLAFFIEQSTRFVEWTTSDMFHDPDIKSSRHAEKYTQALETLASAYHVIKNKAIEFYREKISFNKWQEFQSEKVLKGEKKIQEAKYSREIKGAALDIARFLLPQACKTNIAWILDARSTELDISVWKGNPLSEIRNTAGLIEKHAGQIAPSLLKYTEKDPYYENRQNLYENEIAPPIKIEKGVDIISYDSDSLNKTIAHIIVKRSRGGTFQQRYREAENMSFEEKINLLKRITKDRGPHNEWVGLDEEFDQVKITLEIRTDLGAVRDWRRHQKWDRNESLYTLDNGYHKPANLEEMSKQANEIFDKAMEIAHNAELEIRKDFPFQAQYVVPMAAMHPIIMTAGLDQAQYMLWTRTTPEGNFSYRQDAFNATEALIKTHPWLLGYEKYPENKSFLQVYEEAPLKNILKLQTGPTALHQ